MCHVLDAEHAVQNKIKLFHCGFLVTVQVAEMVKCTACQLGSYLPTSVIFYSAPYPKKER